MYSFEGDFRKTPQQSLGGASKKLGLDDLLRKECPSTAESRGMPASGGSGLKIKAYARGFLSRLHLARELRQDFDAASRVSCDLGSLLRCFTFFYRTDLDIERLVWLSSKCCFARMKWRATRDDPVWRLRICRLLSFNVAALSRPGFPVGTALRLVEVFGSPEVYGGCFRGPTPERHEGLVRSWLQHLWLRLAQRCDLFGQLRKLLVLRIPDPGPKEDSVPQVLTAQAQALVDLMLQPLSQSVAGGPECGAYQCQMITCLLSGLPATAPRWFGWMLPALASRWPLPGEPLLRALLGLEPSPWLFQALLRPLVASRAALPCGCSSPVESDDRDESDVDESSAGDEMSTNGGGSVFASLTEEALDDALEQLNTASSVDALVETAASSRGEPLSSVPACWALARQRTLALHPLPAALHARFPGQVHQRTVGRPQRHRAPSLFV
ncbi:hypothetical protein HPB48_019197 [Haemaphysalis longicornis]|uniref:Uncharacterized protein n=1 Tax=Haemaphysalis longicornis TaxID=44386 RepID=A0A9J6FU80_HAELO|nr:hypothetical protein HPB48_019197 [Haemaphysalis longicornis]